MTNKEKILNVIKNIDKYRIESKEESSSINYKLLNEDINKVSEDLIRGLLKDKLCRKLFFDKIEDIYVFNQNKFIEIIFKTNELMKDSYTKYPNKVGMFIDESDQIQLNFPYKDCVLVGGMDKEDDKVNLEVFYNEILEFDKIDKLFEPKIMSKVKKFAYIEDLAENEELDNPNNIQKSSSIEEIRFEEYEAQEGEQKERLLDNLLLKGNNLLGLHSLARRMSGMIDVIYIDPPYYFENTKSSDSFAYNSNFKLSTWLTFMKNRLEIAKELLSETGVIFISTHDIGSSHLKLLCDDIFGKQNYIDQLSIENNPKGRKNSKFFSKNGEFCFVYSKNMNATNSFLEIVKKDNLNIDENGEEYSNGRRVLVGKSSNKPITNFDSKKNYIVYYNKKTNKIELLYPSTNNERNITLIEKGYKEYISIKEGILIENTYTDSKFIDLFNNKSLIFKENTIYEKDKNIYKRCKSIIIDSPNFDLKTESATKILSELNINFPMSKSYEFIKMLLNLNINKNSIILDFFAGSGTTAHAVLDLNKEDGGDRKFILLEQMDYIESITAERIKRAMIKNKYEDSFIYAELLESDIKNVKNQLKESKSRNELIEVITDNFDKGYFINIDNIKELFNLIEKVYEEKTGKKDNPLLDSIKLIIEKHMDNNIDYVSYEDIEEHKLVLSKSEYILNKSFYGGF